MKSRKAKLCCSRETAENGADDCLRLRAGVCAVRGVRGCRAHQAPARGAPRSFPPSQQLCLEQSEVSSASHVYGRGQPPSGRPGLPSEPHGILRCVRSPAREAGAPRRCGLPPGLLWAPSTQGVFGVLQGLCASIRLAFCNVNPPPGSAIQITSTSYLECGFLPC